RPTADRPARPDGHRRGSLECSWALPWVGVAVFAAADGADPTLAEATRTVRNRALSGCAEASAPRAQLGLARQGRRDREARARRRFDDELASELAHPRPDEVEAESRLGIPPPILRIVHTDAVVDDVHSDRPVDVHEADHHPTGPGVLADIGQGRLRSPQ